MTNKETTLFKTSEYDCEIQWRQVNEAVEDVTCTSP